MSSGAEGIQVQLVATVERVSREGDAVVLERAGRLSRATRCWSRPAGPRTSRAWTWSGLASETAPAACRSMPTSAPISGTSTRVERPGGEQFTHLAAIQAYQATRNALLPGRARGTLEHAPWTVFTDPEVARVGMTEQEARARFGRECARLRLAHLASGSRASRGRSARLHQARVPWVRNDPRRAHRGVARRRDVAGIIAAQQSGKKLGTLAGMIHVYPTYAVGVQQAAAYATEQAVCGGVLGGLVRTW